jgi:hypothetical protein
MSKHNYIDGKELKEELHLFSLSYRKEVKSIFQSLDRQVDYNKKDYPTRTERISKRKLMYKKAYKDANGSISDNLGEMFLLLAENISSKKNWIGYSYKEEMVGKGVLFLCKYAHNFSKYHPRCNAFAYVTTICNNGFIQVWEKEETQSKLKDKLIKESMVHTELDKWLTED